jgi:hypothetical protein
MSTKENFTMSEARTNPHILLDLDGIEFKLVIRALAGDFQYDSEVEKARELGVRLLDQYVRTERDRLKQLSRTLNKLREASEASAPPEPDVTVLRPGSRLVDSGSRSMGSPS